MLHSFMLKLDRAFEHLQFLDNEIKAWIDSKPYEIISENDPEAVPDSVGHHVINLRLRVTRAEPIPPRIGILIGDFLFNMRSALDHLAFSLARTSPNGLTDKQERDSEFPIFLDSNAEQFSRKTACIPPGPLKIIEDVQPYNARNDKLLSPLWIIHDLNRIDKHRELLLFAGASIVRDESGIGREGIGILIKSSDPSGIKGFEVISADVVNLEMNAIPMRFNVTTAGPNVQVSLDAALSVDVLFGNSGRLFRKEVLPILRGVYQQVRDVLIPLFAKFL